MTVQCLLRSVVGDQILEKRTFNDENHRTSDKHSLPEVRWIVILAATVLVFDLITRKAYLTKTGLLYITLSAMLDWNKAQDVFAHEFVDAVFDGRVRVNELLLKVKHAPRCDCCREPNFFWNEMVNGCEVPFKGFCQRSCAIA